MRKIIGTLIIFIFCLKYSSETLLDGIVTLTWEPYEPAVDRYLTSNTHIKLTVICRETTTNSSTIREQMKQNKYKGNNAYKDVKIRIQGRIGRIKYCLPLQSDPFLSRSQLKHPNKDSNERPIEIQIYEELWKEMESRKFTAHIDSCDYDTEVIIDSYSDMIEPVVKLSEAKQLREEALYGKKSPAGPKRRRRDTNDKEKTATGKATAPTKNRLTTWADGYYIIDIDRPEVIEGSERDFDVDIVVSMKNRHGGYITADEYPSLVFYGVMCGIYALFALFWFIWCALHWKELLKIQFWIGGVILLGMIEKSAFVAEYDTVNRHGYKVHFAIVSGEILSCIKRTVSRMLVIIVALGYGIVKPRLGSLKQKVFGIGFIYFGFAATEALIRINTKNDEANNKVFISRIPLAVIDATICYWIFTGLVATTRTLRLKQNIVKLNVYRHFTNTIIFAIVSSLLFMIWSLKSHLFTSCVTNWREFWVDDAFWHILFSFILLVIMFLFRPSNNNQRYAFVPFFDHSDNDDDFEDESAVFDSVTMRKANSMEIGGINSKTRKQNEGNVNTNDSIEDALNYIENNIPTSLADQALQALDSEDEIVNTKLERSKMQ